MMLRSHQEANGAQLSSYFQKKTSRAQVTL